jgi:hypothetical protein
VKGFGFMQLSKLKKLLNSYLTDTNRFLYIVGIQTVRILKRIKRRLSRFLRPVTDLLKHFYAITIGRQIRNLKKEIQSIREGLEIAGTRIAEARKNRIRTYAFNISLGCWKKLYSS